MMITYYFYGGPMLCDRDIFRLRKNISLLIILVLLIGVNACSRSTSASEQSKKVQEVANFALEPFILNLANHGSEGFFKISLSLELANTSLVETAKVKTPQLRDAIITLLSAKSSEDLVAPEGKIQLKDEVLLRANEILREGAVRNIYFTDFVMQ